MPKCRLRVYVRVRACACVCMGGAPLQAKAVQKLTTERAKEVRTRSCSRQRWVGSKVGGMTSLRSRSGSGFSYLSSHDVGSIGSPPSRRGPETAPAGASRQAGCIQSIMRTTLEVHNSKIF